MQEYALRFGNAYAYIQRDSDGKPTQLLILDPTYVTVQIVDQRLYYSVNDVKSGVQGTFSEDQIFHIRAMGDGYVGKSILQYAAESIGGGLAIQTYAASFFGGGATMTGVLEVPGVIQDENTAKSIVNTFKKSYKAENGSNNGIALVHSGAKFTKIAAQPNEAQMVESKEFTVADIARWFRMNLSKVQAGATGSSNLEQLNIEYVTDCLMPWFVRWEQEIERKLFRFDEMERLDAKFNVAMLMRGDMKSTAEYLKTLKYAGFITSNDGRRFIGLNTISETFADQIYSPVNMIPAAKEDEFWANKDQSQASQKGTDQ
jgi:HK97 family phage portal protein